MKLHVVFGAGQVGKRLAATLTASGHRVRIVRKQPHPVGNIEVVSGDAQDPAFVREVTRGAEVIYHCMNPRTYSAEAWEKEFPAFGEALIGAALAQDARLVCLDNLYGYGVVEGKRRENTPMGATGRKGLVRVAWDRRLRSAEGLRWVAGRAGDFFGPGTEENSLFSPSTIRRIAAGKTTWLFGQPQAPHAFSFVPDVVAGLAALGTATSDVERRVWHLPVLEVAPAELVARIGREAGRKGKSSALPSWAFWGLGWVVPILRELRETSYQWDRPFEVDDAAFRSRFPGVATSLADAVSRTLAEVGTTYRASSQATGTVTA